MHFVHQIIDHTFNCGISRAKKDMLCIENAVEKHCKNTCFLFARRIASRAGIVKISNAAMKQIAVDFFMLLVRLLQRPFIIHQHEKFRISVANRMDDKDSKSGVLSLG